jgi:hypothetical protein
MVTAVVLRRLGSRLRLYETGVEDVEIQHDIFIPVAKKDSKGVRVVVE